MRVRMKEDFPAHLDKTGKPVKLKAGQEVDANTPYAIEALNVLVKAGLAFWVARPEFELRK